MSQQGKMIRTVFIMLLVVFASAASAQHIEYKTNWRGYVKETKYIDAPEQSLEQVKEETVGQESTEIEKRQARGQDFSQYKEKTRTGKKLGRMIETGIMMAGVKIMQL